MRNQCTAPIKACEAVARSLSDVDRRPTAEMLPKFAAAALLVGLLLAPGGTPRLALCRRARFSDFLRTRNRFRGVRPRAFQTLRDHTISIAAQLLFPLLISVFSAMCSPPPPPPSAIPAVLHPAGMRRDHSPGRLCDGVLRWNRRRNVLRRTRSLYRSAVHS